MTLVVENYNILSGRESIATVMSRQSATPSYPPEEDHYEAVDVDDQVCDVSLGMSTSEVGRTVVIWICPLLKCLKNV